MPGISRDCHSRNLNVTTMPSIHTRPDLRSILRMRSCAMPLSFSLARFSQSKIQEEIHGRNTIQRKLLNSVVISTEFLNAMNIRGHFLLLLSTLQSDSPLPTCLNVTDFTNFTCSSLSSSRKMRRFSTTVLLFSVMRILLQGKDPASRSRTMMPLKTMKAS